MISVIPKFVTSSTLQDQRLYFFLFKSCLTVTNKLLHSFAILLNEKNPAFSKTCSGKKEIKGNTPNYFPPFAELFFNPQYSHNWDQSKLTRRVSFIHKKKRVVVVRTQCELFDLCSLSFTRNQFGKLLSRGRDLLLSNFWKA